MNCQLSTVNCQLLLAFSLLFSCNYFKKEEAKILIHDLPQIVERDTITAVTLNTSTSYFIYRMQKMGYEYDLIADYANSIGVELEIKVAENITRLEEMLNNGEADIVAYPIQMDIAMKQKFLFCGPEQQNHLVIVQSANRGDTVLKDVTELIGKEIYVKHNTRYHERLINLNNELGGGIIIKDIERDTVTTEDLIAMVSKSEIPYTVSENNLAKLNKTYYRNINTELAISFPQRTSWIVRKDMPALAASVNEWAQNITKRQTFRAAMKRYFERSKNEDDDGFSFTLKKGQISPYDEFFKKYAPGSGYDWQLLASIAYQESKFRLNTESWAGAKGLMGIMPRTARAMNFSPDSLGNPEISIQAGIKCLNGLKKYFSEINDSDENLKFVLAAYNAGNGHIFDAQNLAKKYGKNPNIWDDNVAEYVKLKSEPQYYRDSVCNHGYLRGIETFNYVREVIERYKIYKSKTEK